MSEPIPPFALTLLGLVANPPHPINPHTPCPKCGSLYFVIHGLASVRVKARCQDCSFRAQAWRDLQPNAPNPHHDVD